MSQNIESNYNERDLILDLYVKLVNQFDMNMGFTLYVGGLVITGQLVSYYDYLEGVSKTFGNVDNRIGQLFSEQFTLLKDEVKEFRDSKEEDLQEVNFIHLKDVTIYNINQNTTLTTEYWRGKLKSVDGFNIGNYTFE